MGVLQLRQPFWHRYHQTGSTRATPIMASRLIRAVSSPSGRPTVSGGCSGGTRYRTSALESHTRISVPSSVAVPSHSTVRGSTTIRERYSGDLYHLGEGPRLPMGNKAKCAHHDVMDACGVLFHDQAVHLLTLKFPLLHDGSGINQQPCLEFGVGPGFSDQA